MITLEENNIYRQVLYWKIYYITYEVFGDTN